MRYMDEIAQVSRLGFITLILPSLLVAFSGAGRGTDMDPYQVSTLTQLQEMGDDLTAHYKLVNDIDASATSTWLDRNDSRIKGFTPVGGDSNPFEGSLRGQGYTISHLFIEDTVKTHVGLFGSAKGAKIDSLHLDSVSIIGGFMTGALAGHLDSHSSVDYSSVSGAVHGRYDIGGLIGFNQGEMSHNTSSADLTANAYAHIQIGGLVGSNAGRVTHSQASGTILGVSSLYNSTGGIVGSNGGIVLYSKFTGTLSADSGNVIYLGGIVGDNDGVVGYAETSGLIKLESGYNGWSVGGIVGDSYAGTLHNAISSMDIAISGSNIGGVVGNQRSGAVRNVAFVGSFTPVSGQNGVIGTPGGEDFYSYVDNSYWDTTSTGIKEDSISSPQSSSEMLQQATYVGWDFTNIWTIDEGNGYPTLRWNEFENFEFKSTFYRVSPLSGIIQGPAIQWGNPGNTTQAVTAVAIGDGYRFKIWDDGVLTATRSDVIESEDVVHTAIFGLFRVERDTVLLNGQGSWRTSDTLIAPQADTIITNIDTLVDSSNVVIAILDTIVGNLTVTSDTTILIGDIDTAEVITYDTLNYVPTLTVNMTLMSDTSVYDTTYLRDSTYQAYSDTIVTTYWYEYETNTIINLRDSLYDDVSYSTHLDTLIIKDTLTLNIQVDTLQYQRPTTGLTSLPELVLETGTWDLQVFSSSGKLMTRARLYSKSNPLLSLNRVTEFHSLPPGKYYVRGILLQSGQQVKAYHSTWTKRD